MSISWTLISQMAAAIGVLIASISLLFGLVRYRSDKRREYVYSLRSTIFFSRPTCRTLFRLLSYDYAFEIASSVAQSNTMQVTLDEIYHSYFHPQEGDDTPDVALDMYLEQQFPTILVPIHTELVQTFEKLTSELGQRVEPYRFDYPSLTRVLSTVNEVFVAFEGDYRTYVRDEMLWKQGILAFGQDESEIAQVNSVADLQDKLAQFVVGRWYGERFKEQVAILQDLVEVEEVVTASYLSKPDKDLLAMGSQEARQTFVNPEELENPSDNLQEAYKGLQFVLSGADLRKYLDRVERISNRGS
jgi:hypothetical protein